VPPATPPENLHAMVRYSREHSPEQFAVRAAPAGVERLL